jgi:hypothetical protein
MPSIWVYELKKRVRAGTLSREDAVNIFNTAMLGADAQGFKPTLRGFRSDAVFDGSCSAHSRHFQRLKVAVHRPLSTFQFTSDLPSTPTAAPLDQL